MGNVAKFRGLWNFAWAKPGVWARRVNDTGSSFSFTVEDPLVHQKVLSAVVVDTVGIAKQRDEVNAAEN